MDILMQKYCKFPLVWQAIQYFNYPELMVRTNVMNIILEIMRSTVFFNQFLTKNAVIILAASLSHLTFSH